MFKTNIRRIVSIDILGHVDPLNIVCLGLIWHPFLSLPPVNLAWECGASSGCWLVFPPPQRLQSQHHLQISMLISSSRLHDPLSCASACERLCFFPFWWTSFTANWNGNDDQTQPLCNFFTWLKGLQAHLPKSSLRPSDRVIVCLLVAEVACSVPTEQKRALISVTKAYLNTSHQDLLSEGPNMKTLFFLNPFGDTCGQKDILVFKDCEQYKGFHGEHYIFLKFDGWMQLSLLNLIPDTVSGLWLIQNL